MFNYCTPLILENIEATTSEDGKRYYTLKDGTRLPSVTTILNVKPKQGILDWRKSVGEVEANRVVKIATNRGTNVHTICENYLNNKNGYMKGIMPDAVEFFLSMKPYLNLINNIHYQEAALHSRTLGIAGRVDVIAEYDGRLSVIDFKTASRPKKREDIQDYFQQTAAYALMYEEMIGVPIDDLVIIMGVRDSVPLIFKERTEDHINGLVESIKYYKDQK